jgi:predicted nucleic acid-binding protein
MIVVSNTSPLTNLAAIKLFQLLSRLFGEVHIPDGVWDELNAGGKSWPGSAEAASVSWIQRHSVQNEALVITLMRDLDKGEAESIALALELKADLLLMDEREGRRAAQRLGLQTLGVVGLLLDAKNQKEIGSIRPHLDDLR